MRVLGKSIIKILHLKSRMQYCLQGRLCLVTEDTGLQSLALSCLMTYTLGEKKKLVWKFASTIPPSVQEFCYSFYLLRNRLTWRILRTENLRMLESRWVTWSDYLIWLSSHSQSVRSVPTVRRKPSADLFHLSLSLLPAATGPVVRAQSCWSDSNDYLSLSLSLNWK